jgi:hypothetical protein
MNKSKIVSRIALAASVLLALCCVQPARAGTKGAFIQPNGAGKSSVQLTWTNSSGQWATTVATNSSYSTNVALPTSAVNPLTWFATNSISVVSNLLPQSSLVGSRGALPTIGGLQPTNSVFIQNHGTSIGTWTNSHYITGGVGVENPDFDKRMLVPPSPCSFFSMDSTMVTNNDGKCGVITIEAHSDAGSGMWVRGFEYAVSNLLSADDIVAKGDLKFDYIVAGPFDFKKANCTALIIPFCTQSGISNFYFLLDTVGNSTALTFTCPSDRTIECGVVPTYPDVSTLNVSGSTGPYSVSYSPPANALALGTNAVTATVTDANGCGTGVCLFHVIVQDTTPPVVTLKGLNPMTVECHTVFSDPGATASDTCAGGLPVSVSGSLDVKTPGTYTLFYSATDPSGNPGMTSRTVNVVDTTPPVAPVLSTVTSTDCTSGYAIVPVPSANDACAGPIAGVPNMGVLTTTNTIIISTVGTNTIIWKFTDPSGNQSTANQTVIVGTLVFVGFDSPIGGTGGTCQVPLRTVNPGSNLAIKFTTTCNGSTVFVGQPKVFVNQYPTCTSQPVPIVVDQDFHIVTSEWHFNLDTSHLTTGIYQIIATQADGITVLGKAFIKLK